MKAFAQLAAGLMALALSPLPAIAQDRSVLTYHGDNSRTGNFVIPTLSFEKARSLRMNRAFAPQVAGHLYAQPLYWQDSSAALLVVATQDNVVQAFDATSGKEMWRRVIGRPVSGSSLPCGDIDPLGITGTPVIDPATQAIYFDAAVARANGPRHEIYGLSLKDGAVLSGWPVDVADALRGSGRRFDPRIQNQRAALGLVDDTLYVAFGGHFGDCGNYHGWVVGLHLHDPGKPVSFATRARGGGIWSPGGLSVVGHDLFFATGNTSGAESWSDGEAVFRLGADLRRTDEEKDFFTPSDWKSLDDDDQDLGGSNPLALDIPGPGGERALMLALGKDGKAYLLDRHNLGGIGGQLAAESISDSEIITSPAAFPVGGDVFVALQAPGAHCPKQHAGDLLVLKISAGAPTTMTPAWCGAVRGRASPVVTTTDGRSNPIVWALGAEGDDRLHAFRGDTGEPIFTSAPLGGLRHFQTLIATQDRLYVGADGSIYAFVF